MAELPLHEAFVPTDPGSRALSADEVHVWAVPLTGEAEPFAALLSAAEQDRVQRFRFADHQRRYQIGHGALRRILGGYLGKDPEAVEFRQGPRGKPYLEGQDAGSGPFFNLSHSGQLAVIAVATTELGVDIEKVRRLESLNQIAERHFSNTEFRELDQLEGSDRELAFYRCWTRKEAYIKALGEGLSLALDSFDVSLCEEPKFLACHDGRENLSSWSLVDVSPGPEFVGAIAMRHGGPTVHRHRLAGA
ncbi:MAG: 4'-phosphopantetheinyl transferase superfamily protein [Planctomycetota bacterium]